MFLCKALRHQRFLVAHLKTPNPCQHLVNTSVGDLERNSQLSLQCSMNQRFASASAQSEEQGEVSCASNNARENTKPYDVLFKEAVGLIERTGDFWDVSEIENGGNISELSKRLREVELELQELTEKHGGIEPKMKGFSGRRRRRKVIGKAVEIDSSDSKPNPVSSLYSLFDGNNLKQEQPLEEREGSVAKNEWGLFDKKKDYEKFYKELHETDDLLGKELSPEMEVFVRHLYDEGYFKDANFLPGNKFDIKGLESAYAQDFLKFAAENFGRDKQEIAKWLSGSDLKAIAIFGCPSHEKRVVFAAKSLRTFFQIPENTVCSKCRLRESCKFVNQSVWKSGSKNLHLPSLMRLLTVYALEAVPPQLVLTEDIKACVKRLMKDVINLSKTVQQGD